MNKQATRRGIYLLPNLMTTLSLFAAYYSIVSSIRGQYEAAAVAIFLGLFADSLDGRIARLTNTQTAFGAEYDSLSDMVSFGVAPSLLIYSVYLHHFGKLGWLLAFTYTVAVALRLARFNTQVETADKRYFQGLACPAAAAVLSSFTWIAQKHGFASGWSSYLCTGLCLAVSVLMVSNIRYSSFKEIDFKGKIPFIYTILLILGIVAIAAEPAWVLFVIFGLYFLSGPVQTLVGLQLRRRKRKFLLQRRSSAEKGE